MPTGGTSLFHVSFKKFLPTSRETRGRLLFPHDKQHKKKTIFLGSLITEHSLSHLVVQLSTACKCYFRSVCDYGRTCTLRALSLRNYDGRFYSLQIELPMDQPPEEIVPPSTAPHWTLLVQQQVRGGGGCLSVSLCFLTAQSKNRHGPDTSTWKGELQPPKEAPRALPLRGRKASPQTRELASHGGNLSLKKWA